MVTFNDATADLPTTVLPSVQTKVRASPSGSLDSEPFNSTGVVGPVAGRVWSGPALATGGVLVMVTWVVAVEERPAVSVTVSVYVCTPMVTVNDTTADLPTTVLPSVQTKVRASPSGSLDSEPFSVTAVVGPVAGRVWSGPALATGGWLVMVTRVTAVEESPAVSVTVSVNVYVPIFSVNGTTAELPTTVPPCVQTKVRASPSGSLASEPFSVTAVVGPVAGRVWSGPALATGGLLVMVTWVVAVEERPAVSVTVSVYVCTPMVTVKDTTAELPTTVLPSVQTKVRASPSGSLDSEPFSVTAVVGPVAGRVWSGPALATGGVLVMVTWVVAVEERSAS